MSGDSKQGKTLDTGERSAGGRLVASDGRMLPLRDVQLGADARGGLARVVLEQRFVNPYAAAGELPCAASRRLRRGGLLSTTARAVLARIGADEAD